MTHKIEKSGFIKVDGKYFSGRRPLTPEKIMHTVEIQFDVTDMQYSAQYENNDRKFRNHLLLKMIPQN